MIVIIIIIIIQSPEEKTVVGFISYNSSSKRYQRIVSYFDIISDESHDYVTLCCRNFTFSRQTIFILGFGYVRNNTALLHDAHMFSFIEWLNQNSWCVLLATCRAPLGVQSGAIPDSSFEASSILDPSLSAHTARIRSAIEGGGWCPKRLIDSQSEEYIQINFLNLTVITLIETQGRHGPFHVRNCWTCQTDSFLTD